MSINPENIKQLRSMTQAGILDCKKTLEEVNGDIEKAAALLRERGIIKAVKKMDREQGEGSIFSYIHHNGKLGVIVEIGCETDFVARNEQFQDLGKNIAMHIAASDPTYIHPDEVPDEIVNKESEIFRKELIDEGKPENVIDKILEGKLKKFKSELSLLEQPYVKEPKQTISDLLKESIATLGENISVRKFTRYSIG